MDILKAIASDIKNAKHIVAFIGAGISAESGIPTYRGEGGSSSVIELHGTTRIIHCMECSKKYPMDEVFAKLEKQVPPLCSKCSGILRPAVVFFGETLDPL